MNEQPLFDLNKYDDRLVNCTVWNGDIRELNPETLPHRHRVGIIDFPWFYDNQKSNQPRLGGYTYTPMQTEDLCALAPIINGAMLPDSLLYVWGTWPKFNDYIQVYQTFQLFGWDVVTGFPWVKVEKGDHESPRFLTGHWWGGCSEYVLLWRRGKVSPPESAQYLGLLAQNVLEHSRKPDDLHELAQQTKGPYIEFFARRPVANWTVVGNELGEYQGVMTE